MHWTTVWRRAKSRPGQAKGIDIIKTPFGHRVTRAEIGRILGRPLEDADLYGLLFDDKQNSPLAAAPDEAFDPLPRDPATLHAGEPRGRRGVAGGKKRRPRSVRRALFGSRARNAETPKSSRIPRPRPARKSLRAIRNYRHGNKTQNSSAARTSAADVERLDTWMPEMPRRRGATSTTRPTAVSVQARIAVWSSIPAVLSMTSPPARAAAAQSSLSSNSRLRPDQGVTIAKKYLAQHPGTGRLSGGVDADEDAVTAEDDLQRATETTETWQAAQPIDGSPAEVYLKSRGLNPDPLDRTQLRQLKNLLTGSVSMVAAITTTDGALVALQETLLTTEGKKADVKVVRRTMRGPHDWNMRGFVRFGNPRAKTVFICEGVEDALSTRAAGAEYTVALTGIARLRRIDIPDHVEAIVLVRDDDAPGSPADDALWRGIVAVMGRTDSRMVVKITPKPSSMLSDMVFGMTSGAPPKNGCGWSATNNRRVAASRGTREASSLQ